MQNPTLKKKQTVSQLAESLGVARSTLYQWKSEGAPIGDGELAVLKWALSESKGDSSEMRDAKLGVLKENERRLKIANDNAEKLVISRAVVSDSIARAQAMLFSELDRVFLSELPPQLVSIDDPVKIKKIAQQSIHKLCDSLRIEYRKLCQGD